MGWEGWGGGGGSVLMWGGEGWENYLGWGCLGMGGGGFMLAKSLLLHHVIRE